jgi:hypothetical protein
MTARRIYAEPVERDGTTLIAAARIRGAGGLGRGIDERQREGSGGGYALAGRPVGAYIIKDGRVRWRPAVDANLLIATIGAVTVTALILTARRITTR